MRFEVHFTHWSGSVCISVCVCNVIAIKKRTTKWLQLVDSALLAQLVRNYEHTIKCCCSGQMIMCRSADANWLATGLKWHHHHHHHTTPHHTTTWWLLLWLLVLLSLWTLRLSSLEWLPSLFLSLSFSLSDTRLITMAEWKGNGGEEEARENHSLVILLLSVYDGKIGAYHRPSS